MPLLLIVVLCRPGAAQSFRAAVASVVITPEVKNKTVYIAGFGHNRVATGAHDDLYARCLALSVRSKTLVLCAADLIGLFYSDVRAIREQLYHAAPEADLIVAATHNHEGPDTLGLWGPSETQSGVDEAYLASVRQRIAETAIRAVGSLQPARLELARDDHPLLGQLQGVDRPPFVKDPFLFVLRLSTPAGKPIATLVNFSDHPETLARNTEVSADYPHWVREYVEARGGGMALFFSGAVGKVSPLGSDVALQDPETGKIAADGTWRKAELLGSTIGELAMRALASAEVVDPDVMVVRKRPVFVYLNNERFRNAVKAGLFGDRRPLFPGGEWTDSTRIRTRGDRELQTEVAYIQLRSGAHVIAEFAAVPGEIYPELVNGGVARFPGADFPDAPLEPLLRQLFKSKYQFVLGLANDELGYLIPKAEWDAQPPWLQNAPKPWYGEINSVGPDAAGAVMRALAELMR